MYALRHARYEGLRAFVAVKVKFVAYVMPLLLYLRFVFFVWRCRRPLQWW